MKLKVYKPDGSAFTEKEFDIPSFEGDKGVALLKQVIVSYQANKRQGTCKTKDYGEVAGGAVEAYDYLVQDFSMVLMALDSLPVQRCDHSCRWEGR